MILTRKDVNSIQKVLENVYIQAASLTPDYVKCILATSDSGEKVEYPNLTTFTEAVINGDLGDRDYALLTSHIKFTDKLYTSIFADYTKYMVKNSNDK